MDSDSPVAVILESGNSGRVIVMINAQWVVKRCETVERLRVTAYRCARHSSFLGGD
jgi:hypothetical protein